MEKTIKLSYEKQISILEKLLEEKESEIKNIKS